MGRRTGEGKELDEESKYVEENHREIKGEDEKVLKKLMKMTVNDKKRKSSSYPWILFY